MDKDISQLLSLVLPDERTVGEPYWAIMESVPPDGKLTGKFWTIAQSGRTVVPLFSRAEDASSVCSMLPARQNMVVRGITRRHMQFLRRRPPQGAELGVVNALSPTGELTVALLPPV